MEIAIGMVLGFVAGVCVIPAAILYAYWREEIARDRFQAEVLKAQQGFREDDALEKAVAELITRVNSLHGRGG